MLSAANRRGISHCLESGHPGYGNILTGTHPLRGHFMHGGV